MSSVEWFDEIFDGKDETNIVVIFSVKQLR